MPRFNNCVVSKCPLKHSLDELCKYLSQPNSFSSLADDEYNRMHYSSLLLMANINQKQSLEAYYAIELGRCYQESLSIQEKIYALSLYNYAYQVTCHPHKNLKKLIAETEHAIIATFFNTRVDINSISKKNYINRKYLKNFRSLANKKINTLGDTPSIQDILQIEEIILDNVKHFFTRLLNQAITLAGNPPCKYAVIGFGSFANKLMTHYSDIEFGFLIDQETRENKEYFTHLAYILYVSVINLGETILPAMRIPYLKGTHFYDRTTKRGLSFDGLGVNKGGKTPLGDGKLFSLIHTPEQMVRYLEKDEQGIWWHEKEEYLAPILIHYEKITGNDDLITRYQECLQRTLSKLYDDTMLLKEFLAGKHLIHHDNKKFDPSLFISERERVLINTKNDFYMYLSIMVNRLALLNDVHIKGVRNKIQLLAEQQIIDEQLTYKLIWASAHALCLRLKTFAYYNSRKEFINSLSMNDTKKNHAIQIYTLNDNQLKCVKSLYEIIISLHTELFALLKKKI